MSDKGVFKLETNSKQLLNHHTWVETNCDYCPRIGSGCICENALKCKYGARDDDDEDIEDVKTGRRGILFSKQQRKSKSKVCSLPLARAASERHIADVSELKRTMSIHEISTTAIIQRAEDAPTRSSRDPEEVAKVQRLLNNQIAAAEARAAANSTGEKSVLERCSPLAGAPGICATYPT